MIRACIFTRGLKSVVKLYSASQVRAIDQAEIAAGTPGIVLMERAGNAVFAKVFELWPECDELIVLCGSGNNAGDGYVVAKLAQEIAISVSAFYLKPPLELKGDALCAAQSAIAAGVTMHPVSELAVNTSGRCPVIIDALLGTGFTGELSSEYLSIIDWVNAQSLPVLSVDLPSGIHADTGAAAQSAVHAQACVSLVGQKQGLFTGQGKQCAGRLFFDDLSIARSAYDLVSSTCALLAPGHLRRDLERQCDSHKGRHGHVAVIGGFDGTSGAALLAAEASLRTGAGLTSMFSSQTTVNAALVRCPEVMSLCVDDASFDERLSKASAICLGPGLGLSDYAVALANKVLEKNGPKVLDADALTLLAENKLALSSSEFIMTPHPGEAARLLGLSNHQVQADRFAAVKQLHELYGGVVVLKGAGTLICDGDSIWVCDKGNPAMAVGGMGDILSGVLAALIAQGLTLREAAQLGVWTHSYAADIEVAKTGQIGLAASDLISTIRHLLNGQNL